MLLLFFILIMSVLVLLGAALAIRSVIVRHNQTPAPARHEEEISNQL